MAERPAGRTLVLLRHAKSDWSTGEPDPRRPLAGRGRRQAPEAGRWLAANLDAIDLAVVSPATRARQTWELAGEWVAMKTSALAVFTLSGSWADAGPERATLLASGRPPA